MNKNTARELTKAMVIYSLQMSFEPVLDPRRRKGTYDASSLIVMANYHGRYGLPARHRQKDQRQGR